MLTIDPHPLLDALAFTSTLPGPMSSLPSPEWLTALLKPGRLRAALER